MLAPPSFSQRARELLLGRDIVRLAWRTPGLRTLPRGDGGPVLLTAGFGASDLSLLPLRRFLRELGHDPRSAELGRVGDDVRSLAPAIADRVRRIADETGRQVSLVGWSIGGVLSREAARDDPDPVRRVITFGSPVEGGPSYTALAGRYSEKQRAEIRATIEQRSQTPIRVPVTAIWSRNDGIVTPEACVDRRTPGVENIEVTGTHIGMGVDPDVWTIVAERLATDPD